MATFTRFMKHWYVTLSLTKVLLPSSAVVIATAAEEMLTTNSITGSTLKVGSAEGRPNQVPPSIMKRDERQHNILDTVTPVRIVSILMATSYTILMENVIRFKQEWGRIHQWSYLFQLQFYWLSALDCDWFIQILPAACGKGSALRRTPNDEAAYQSLSLYCLSLQKIPYSRPIQLYPIYHFPNQYHFETYKCSSIQLN